MADERIAVVVVHGMGNQFPMQTLGTFVDALKPESAVLYSSPNRITEERETRRLSFNTANYDFFEYYWAHYIDEPGITPILKWAFSLVYVKPPSARLQPFIKWLRIGIPLLLLLMGIILWKLFLLLKGHDILSITLFGTSVFVLLKLLWSIISSTVAGRINSSLGDVIKYTVPSPKNIAAREQIRKSGIDLLKKLHDSKTGKGDFKYSRIVVVAHSLGTVVAYDILTSLFAQYHHKFAEVIPDLPETPNEQPGEPPRMVQAKMQEMLEKSATPDHSGGEYQQLQSELFKECRLLTNEWRVSNFITMGSPLTHAAMILAPSKKDFERKKNQREFPMSPPQIDHKDEHFAFDISCFKAQKKEVKVKSLHHAAHFAATQWTNIFFTNDWIGGRLAGELGAGIVDIEVQAGTRWIKAIPLASHTKYWDKEHPASLHNLVEIFTKIHVLKKPAADEGKAQNGK